MRMELQLSVRRLPALAKEMGRPPRTESQELWFWFSRRHFLRCRDSQVGQIIFEWPDFNGCVVVNGYFCGL